MARVDKTESAVGVVRGTLRDNFPEARWGQVVGVGLDASGLVVPGGGQSGVIGVAIFDRTNYRAGQRVDIFVLAEILEVALAAGTVYYAAAGDGAISTTNTGARVGFTVEADRLVIRL